MTVEGHEKGTRSMPEVYLMGAGWALDGYSKSAGRVLDGC